LRLGIARDAAFCFYYADNLEAFQQAGAEWVPFSPLGDRQLPEGLAGLYFGGGYPELHAAGLAGNRAMLDAVREFAASGRAIYAECGGMIYLGRSLTTLDGRRHELSGVLPLDTAMLERLKTLGYAEITLAADCLWGRAGQVCRGHEFHYSEIIAEDDAADGWRRAYSVGRRRGQVAAGLARGNILAGYVHLHWASSPSAIGHFLARCRSGGGQGHLASASSTGQPPAPPNLNGEELS
jgi:cobyrinic acid a,c-diamide synthase